MSAARTGQGRRRAAIARGVRLGLLVAILAGLVGLKAALDRRPRPAEAPLPLPSPAVAASDLNRVAELESRAAMAPRDPELALALGGAYAGLNRLPEALESFRRAARLNPQLIPARVGQAQIWMRMGRPLPAVEGLEWAVARLPDNAELRLELAAAYLALRDIIAAIRHLRKAVELAPDNAEAHRALASGYMSTQTYDAARAEARRATNLEPSNPVNWTVLGSVELNSSRFDEAEKALRQALQIKPDDPTANVLLSRRFLEGNPTPESKRAAQGMLARALVVDPFHAEALHLLGRIYADAGRLERAIPILRRAREADPRSERVILLLGQTLTRAGEAEEGRILIAEAQRRIESSADFVGLEYQAARNPNPNVQIRLAEMYIEQGVRDPAVHLLRKALARPGVAPADRLRLQAVLRRAESRDGDQG